MCCVGRQASTLYCVTMVALNLAQRHSIVSVRHVSCPIKLYSGALQDFTRSCGLAICPHGLRIMPLITPPRTSFTPAKITAWIGVRRPSQKHRRPTVNDRRHEQLGPVNRTRFHSFRTITARRSHADRLIQPGLRPSIPFY